MSEQLEKPKNDESKLPPVWAWIFIIACVAIPVISLGGAIPGAIGVGTAAACYQVSKDKSRSTQSNIIFCVGLTVLAWALFLGFVYLVVPMLLNQMS